jgi:hypothetical protein
MTCGMAIAYDTIQPLFSICIITLLISDVCFWKGSELHCSFVPDTKNQELISNNEASGNETFVYLVGAWYLDL